MSTQKSSSATRTFQILTGAALAMAALLALLPAAGHDQLWFLLMAQRWLAGAQLYGPQAFDSNTPAIVWLSAVPVTLAPYLHLAIPAMAKLLTLVLELAIAAISYSLLRPVTPTQRWFLAFTFVTLFAIIPARDFGQRDLLTTLLLLPYLLATSPATNPGAPGLASETWTFTLLAAAGLCLKPHLALIPVAVEFLLFMRHRRVRLQTLLFLLAGALFLLAIHLFAPLYFTSALPTARATYWAIGRLSPWQLLLEAPQLALLALATLTFCLIRSRSALVDTFLIAASAATLAYVLQGTGWYYQQLPAILLFGLALAFQLLTLHLTTPRWLPPCAAALGILAIVLTFHFSGYPPINADTTYAIDSPDPTFFGDLAPGTSTAILTTSVEDAMMPVARYHLVWAQRTNNLWTLPAILRGTRLTPVQQATLATQQRRWMVEDLTRWRPQLILVARCQDPKVHCQTLEDRHDNLLAFFEQDQAFNQVFANYHFCTSKGSYDAYTLTQPQQDRCPSMQIGLTPSQPRYNHQMAKIYPFRALRYDTNKVRMEDVVTQPYDKITPEMQQAYYDRSKYNLIRVILGKKEPGDTDAFAPPPEGETAHNVYTRAAESLVSWRKKAILREEAEPALYGYSQTYTVPSTDTVQERRGFIALGHLYDYADQVVYRHEQTFPKHKSDRLALFKATRAYCEQIYMLYADPAFTAEELIFGDRTKDTKPADLEIVDEYNVIHRVWKLTDPHLINLIVTAMADKKLIIADGHHRYETSVTYMHERARALGIITTPLLSSHSEAEGSASVLKDSEESPSNRADDPESPTSALGSLGWNDPQALLPKPAFPEAAMMMTFVNMEAPGITILPTHRVVFGLPGFSAEAFLTAAENYFDILPIASPDLSLLAESKQVAFLAATAQATHLLTAKPEVITRTLKQLHPEITARQAALDVVQLHRIVLEHLLHLTHESIANTENIRYIRSPEEAVQQVHEGKADIAFLIRPVTLQQLNDISLSGDVMPQKSTDFYPKLLSGLAIYALD